MKRVMKEKGEKEKVGLQEIEEKVGKYRDVQARKIIRVLIVNRVL